MKRVCGLVLVLAGLTGGAGAAEPSPGPDADALKAFEIFAQVLELVKDNYLEPVDSEVLIRGAVEGMVTAVDRYGDYVPPGEPSGFPSTRAAVAAGVVLGVKGGHLTAVRVLPGSAAEAAGLQSGDQIYLLSGRPGFRLSLRQADELLSGPAGRRVDLKIGRPAEQRTLDLAIELAPLPAAPAPVLEEAPGGALVLRAGWGWDGRDTALLRQALDRQPAGGLVIDLRQAATGGELEGIEAARLLAAPDQAVAAAQGAPGTPVQKWYGSRSQESYPPLAVLVGPSTAGPAEVLAAAVQRLGRGRLVGRPTFGKANLQKAIPLEQGGTLVVSTARLLDAAGRPIGQQGLEIDLVAAGEPAADGADPEFQQALADLTGGGPATE